MVPSAWREETWTEPQRLGLSNKFSTMADTTILVASFRGLLKVVGNVLASGTTLTKTKTETGLSPRQHQQELSEVSVGLFEVFTTVDCVLKPELPAVRSG